MSGMAADEIIPIRLHDGTIVTVTEWGDGPVTIEIDDGCGEPAAAVLDVDDRAKIGRLVIGSFSPASPAPADAVVWSRAERVGNMDHLGC